MLRIALKRDVQAITGVLNVQIGLREPGCVAGFAACITLGILKMSRLRLRLLFFVACIAFFIPAEAKQCTPSGLFFRSHGDELKIEPVNSQVQPNIASFRLIVLGNLVQDALIQSIVEGEISFTEDHCLGVFSEGDMCRLVFDFSSKSVKIREIGSCMSGAGVYPDGTFLKTTKPERYLR